MFYNENKFFATLKFKDIYPDFETFEIYMNDVLTPDEVIRLSPYDELYRLLQLKYYNAYTRYTTPETFTMALVRETRIHFPIYKVQMSLNEQAMELDINDINNRFKTLRNLVENPNMLNENMDTVPLKNTSSQQESLIQKGNMLGAVMEKYSAINRNYQETFYRMINSLFKVFMDGGAEILFVDKGE